MSDGKTPPDDPERDGATGPPVVEAVSVSPETPQQANPELAEQANRGHKGMWLGVAVLCVVAGTVGSLRGAHTVARNDSSKARVAFQQSSAGIASTLKLAIQRQEELTVAAGTFFAANPKASHTEFAAWVSWARTQHRYPELDALGLRVTGTGQGGEAGPLRVPLNGRSAQGIIAAIGAELTRFQIAEPTLEDAYLLLLERAGP